MEKYLQEFYLLIARLPKDQYALARYSINEVENALKRLEIIDINKNKGEQV